MKLSHTLCMLCCLIVMGYGAYGQSRYQTVKKAFKITGVWPSSRDTAVAYIYATKKSGIVQGTRGVVTTLYDDQYTLETGNGFVISSSDTGTYVYIISDRKALTDSLYMPKLGDIITLDVNIPSQQRSIFFDLDLLGITFFKRQNDTQLYDFEQTIYRDNARYRDSIISECIAETKREYERNKANSEYGKVLGDGRYKGRKLIDVMQRCSYSDVVSFLMYVKEHPASYIGQNYYFGGSFASWVWKNGPSSSQEFFDSLAAWPVNSKKFIDYVRSNKTTILEQNFPQTWAFKAINEQDKGHTAEPAKIFRILGPVTALLQDDKNSGLYHYSRGYVYNARGEYHQAVKAYDSALIYFKPRAEGFYFIEVLIQKGYTWRILGNLTEAEKSLDRAIAAGKDTTTRLGGDDRNDVLGKIYYQKGVTYSAFDEYGKAVTTLREAHKYYSVNGSYFNIGKVADVQNSLADVYKKQGAYEDALQMYRELQKTYLQLSDVSNSAYTNNNIGYVLFRQGKYREAIQAFRVSEKIDTLLKLYDKASYPSSQIGQAYWNLGNYDSAIINHSQSIEYAKAGNSPADEAYSWKNLGSLYNLVGDKTKALSAYDKSTSLYEAIGDSSGIAENLSAVGDVYKTDKQYQKAFGYYEKAHRINIGTGKKSSLIDSYFKLGEASYYFDTAASRINYTACYQLAKEIDDKSNLLYSALNLGLLAVKNYDYNLSEKFFREGLALSIAQNSKSNEAYTYEQIGYGKQQQLEFDDAFSSFGKAFSIYDSLGEKSKLPNLYSILGYALQSKGEFDKSISYYERSKSLAYSLKNMADVAGALQYLSYAYTLSGEPQKALAAADSSLAVFRDLGNNWQMANAYLTLGNAYNGTSDFQKAVQHYMLADSLYTLEKDDWSRGIAMNNIGNVYSQQADYKKSLEYLLKADGLYKQLKVVNENILSTRINIGDTYYSMSEPGKAKEYLVDANKRSKERSVVRMVAGSDIVLAKIALDENKLAEAKQYLDEGKDASYKSNEAAKIVEIHLLYGKLYEKQDNFKECVASLTTAIAYAKKTTSGNLWDALYQLGLVYYEKNNYDSAIVLFKEAVDIVEAGASKLFGGAEAKKIYAADTRKIDLYNKLVASLAKLKKTEEALFYADKSNSQAIKEKLEQSGVITADKEKTAALKKGGELLQKQTAIEQAIAKEKAKPEKERNDQLIASLEGVKKIAEEDYINFINDLVKKYPELQGYFTKTNPADFRNYIEYIPDSTLVVLYVINENQLYIFTVTSQETSIKVIELKEDINKQAMKLLSILKNPENVTGTGAIQVRATIRDKNVVKGDFKQEASALYNLLITPIADQLKDKKNLCIIPNAALSSIPFATLGKMGDDNRFHFLIEDYCIFYTNKMDVFSKPYKPGKIEASMVAFGNPDKSLPGASLEVSNIKSLFPGTTIYLEDEATEERAKTALKTTRYVHFATHGILDNTDFSQSYLLLNKDQSNDGRLTLSEINGLIKSENDMIFLSACEMAVPKEISRGWDISVLNAFLSNRVRTAAAGLWQVPDEATTLLLSEFYKNIRTMSRSEAIRKAQAKLSQDPKFSHPYFWGAFVLYGDWR